MSDSYTLTVIEEIETPLAEAPVGNMMILPVIAIVICVALLFTVFFYVAECNKYRRRYEKLRIAAGEAVENGGWNLSHLKELVMEEEANAADRMLGESFSLS